MTRAARLLPLALAGLLALTGCAGRRGPEPPAPPEPPEPAAPPAAAFPDLPAMDPAVYARIRRTCRRRWRLENMKMETFRVRSARDGYLVECDGTVDGELCRCAIRVDAAGEWVNDGMERKRP